MLWRPGIPIATSLQGGLFAKNVVLLHSRLIFDKSGEALCDSI